MESKSKLHLYPSTLLVSVAKWLPCLGLLFPLKNIHHDDTTTLRSLPAPGSLRDAHEAACAWFLGPKAENADYFMMSVETILNDVIQCRRNFAPEDKVCILPLGGGSRPDRSTLVGFL